MAKDLNVNSIPEEMYHNNIKISQTNLTDEFGAFFTSKVNSIVSSVQLNPHVYNGRQKVNECNSFFMSSADIRNCISSIKTKNCEGFDRIPQRILIDGASILLNPLSKLFEKNLHSKYRP